MGAVAMLLFRASGNVCALPLESVGETMRPLPIEPLPGTATFVRGLAIVRGEPTPVIDARLLLGATSAAEATRFVTLHLGPRRAMIAVDAVVGVRSIDVATMASLPPLTGALATELARAMGALDDALLLVLSAAAIVPDTLWDELGASVR